MDDWRLRLPEDRQIIVASCEQCGCEIYYREEFYKTKQGKIHSDCLDDLIESVIEPILVEGLEGLT